MRTRAIGEHPGAADTVGIDVLKLRYFNVTIAGGLAGLGGSYLALEAVGTFSRAMSGGRGFLALAVMIFGRRTPFGAYAAALFSVSPLRYKKPISVEQYLRHSAAICRDAAVCRDNHRCSAQRAYRVDAGSSRSGSSLRERIVMPEILLAARNVTKQFPGVLANDKISAQLRPGRILALLGENGAGKSAYLGEHSLWYVSTRQWRGHH